MLADPSVDFTARPIDAFWVENRFVPHDVTGFEPLGGTIFVARRSRLYRWLKAPNCSVRSLNERDLLVRAVFRAAHDYLHVWATRLLEHAVGFLGRSRYPTGPEDVETLTFLHLLTEAVATVGLDYWCLCTMDLDDRLRVGTTMDAGWSTRYHERHLVEYRRFMPNLNVQHSTFFTTWVSFYCTGELPGVRPGALAQSPRILSWLEHELRYGAMQRRYARMWFRYLATGEVAALASDAAPVPCAEPWKVALTDIVAHSLWKAARSRRFRCEPPLVPRPAPPHWQAKDFRFVSWSALSASERVSAMRHGAARGSGSYWKSQCIAEVDSSRVSPEVKAAVTNLLRRGTAQQVHALTQKLPRLSCRGDQPRRLMFLA